MRTGHSHDELAAYFKLSNATVSRRIIAARSALLIDFVPTNLCYRSRREILESKTIIANMLYTPNDPDAIVLVWDGTYIYTKKSANMGFQKETYNDQKNVTL